MVPQFVIGVKLTIQTNYENSAMFLFGKTLKTITIEMVSLTPLKQNSKMFLVYALETHISCWGRFSRFHELVRIKHRQLYSLIDTVGPFIVNQSNIHTKHLQVFNFINLTQVPSVRQWWIFGG